MPPKKKKATEEELKKKEEELKKKEEELIKLESVVKKDMKINNAINRLNDDKIKLYEELYMLSNEITTNLHTANKSEEFQKKYSLRLDYIIKLLNRHDAVLDKNILIREKRLKDHIITLINEGKDIKLNNMQKKAYLAYLINNIIYAITLSDDKIIDDCKLVEEIFKFRYIKITKNNSNNNIRSSENKIINKYINLELRNSINGQFENDNGVSIFYKKLNSLIHDLELKVLNKISYNLSHEISVIPSDEISDIPSDEISDNPSDEISDNKNYKETLQKLLVDFEAKKNEFKFDTTDDNYIDNNYKNYHRLYYCLSIYLRICLDKRIIKKRKEFSEINTLKLNKPAYSKYTDIFNSIQKTLRGIINIGNEERSKLEKAVNTILGVKDIEDEKKKAKKNKKKTLNDINITAENVYTFEEQIYKAIEIYNRFISSSKGYDFKFIKERLILLKDDIYFNIPPFNDSKNIKIKKIHTDSNLEINKLIDIDINKIEDSISDTKEKNGDEDALPIDYYKVDDFIKTIKAIDELVKDAIEKAKYVQKIDSLKGLVIFEISKIERLFVAIQDNIALNKTFPLYQENSSDLIKISVAEADFTKTEKKFREDIKKHTEESDNAFENVENIVELEKIPGRFKLLSHDIQKQIMNSYKLKDINDMNIALTKKLIAEAAEAAEANKISNIQNDDLTKLIATLSDYVEIEERIIKKDKEALILDDIIDVNNKLQLIANAIQSILSELKKVKEEKEAAAAIKIQSSFRRNLAKAKFKEVIRLATEQAAAAKKKEEDEEALKKKREEQDALKKREEEEALKKKEEEEVALKKSRDAQAAADMKEREETAALKKREEAAAAEKQATREREAADKTAAEQATREREAADKTAAEQATREREAAEQATREREAAEQATTEVQATAEIRESIVDKSQINKLSTINEEEYDYDKEGSVPLLYDGELNSIAKQDSLSQTIKAEPPPPTASRSRAELQPGSPPGSRSVPVSLPGSLHETPPEQVPVPAVKKEHVKSNNFNEETLKAMYLYPQKYENIDNNELKGLRGRYNELHNKPKQPDIYDKIGQLSADIDIYNNANNGSGDPNDPDGRNSSESLEYIKGKLNRFENDPNNPLEAFEIKFEDRLVFIIVTFFIRYAAISIIQRGIDINIIKSFYEGFIYYGCIYILFFWFIVLFINIDNHYDIDYINLNHFINYIRSLFYYFYMGTNGISRLIIHSLLILVIIIIPIILNIKKEKSKDTLNDDEDDPNAKGEKLVKLLSLEERAQLSKALSLFTLFIWILTSIIATKF